MKVGIVLAVIFLGGVGYFGYKFWRSENSSGVIRSKDDDMGVVLGGRALREPTAIPEGENKYRGKYMTFDYPRTANVVPNGKTEESILEKVDIMGRDPKVNIVAVAMRSAEHRFEDIPGVKLRRNQKEEYTEKKVIVGISDGMMFSKLDGKEYTVYVFSGERLYTLSVTAINKSVLSELWPGLLSSFSVL
jgi:hypothetical protein